ncbi:MAG TPA: T9SS type A sorting domain-containing protein [Saprospiraceae bacterium]|nr:T9SS type A sorting domain-containing protein [Saprospiraceae bacterium]HMU03041.1 T9SS type A sorting domain-containing protein [Saprospiraceae bacterium]
MNSKIKFSLLGILLFLAHFVFAITVELTPSTFPCGTTSVSATTGCSFMGAMDVTIDGNPSGVTISNISLIVGGAFTFDITVDATSPAVGRLNFRILTSNDPTGCALPNAQDDVDVNFTCISSSIKDFDLAQVKMYPNPTSNILNINCENANLPKEMVLKNVFGTTIARYYDTNSLDVSSLPSGMYFLTFNDENHILTRSFTVQR